MSAVIANCGRVVLGTSLYLLEPQGYNVKTNKGKNETMDTVVLTSDMCIFIDGKEKEKASQFLAALG